MSSVPEPKPLGAGPAAAAVVRCLFTTLGLLLAGRIHLPTGNRGLLIGFADETTAVVFRETVLDRPVPRAPCVLVVRFRLRAVRGRGHALFRRESVLNTVLFAGFPGFITKLWLGHDENGTYRGIYEWDGPESAQVYARTLWRVLAPVSVPGSIDYHVVPGVLRGDLLALGDHDSDAWWQPVDAVHRRDVINP
ncbi:hypothetical protein [Nocardia vaccinii]|uniref:hypothetical protein n=1 Tax=Nocardia vaccinii TaxID=1822 RepID=UPI00082D255B|nr:hypothetical protein [Nocardia vaccinii]